MQIGKTIPFWISALKIFSTTQPFSFFLCLICETENFERIMRMIQYYDLKDETLVELTLLGNDKAFEELVLRHERAVRQTALRVTNNVYSAEDASQDAFVSAWVNLCNLRERDNFSSWVCSIAKNCAKNVVARYRSAIPDISFNVLENLDLSDESESELIPLLRESSRTEELREALDLLSEKIREVLVLHYFEGFSVKEIATKLSLPTGTVKWRLSEGRKQLRKGFGIVEKEFIEDEALVKRVMRQVEELKLWQIKNDKSGFEKDFCEVLKNVEALPESKEKNHALADVLLRGYWWLPGKKNEEVYKRIKKAAENGHNDDVMQYIMYEEYKKYRGKEK